MAGGRLTKLKTGQLSSVPILSTVDKKIKLWDALAEGLIPPGKLDLDEWSDKYRKLPKTTSSEPGQWRTSRFPFLRRIMKLLSPSSIAREVVAIKGAQLGFTEICINWILYIADQEPGPTMYVQKTKDAALDFSTQKLIPGIEECPRVAHTLGDKKPTRLSDEQLNKGFPGGFVVMGGANSGAFLRSKSIANGAADEEDSFKSNIDGEGSPIGMIRKRLANFPFSKFFRLSTPKFTETSTIEPAYRLGSQEQYYVPCPHCNPRADIGGTYWTIKWSNIHWSKERDSSGLPTEIWLTCEECGAVIHEHNKTWMMEEGHGRWMSEKESPGEPYEVGDVELPSFQISSLYSPLGFFSWRDAVAEWFAYRESKDKALLQVFINQTLGESFSAAGQDISSNWLHERREPYAAKVPHGVLCLTAGVDVQDDRLELEVVGWGLNGESWSIDYAVLPGDPNYLGDEWGLDPTGQPTVWALLDEYINAKYKDESGADRVIECTLVDAGHKTETVNHFCKYREYLRVYPIHGSTGWGKGYLKRPNRRHEKYHTVNYILWVDELKEKTYSMLRIDRPGPGFCHYPEYDHYDQKHFRQLTAENKTVENVKGKKVAKWNLPSGARNEQLDCRNYAYGGLLVYAPNLEYRAQQAGLAGLGTPDQAVGTENGPTHLENRTAQNNPRQALAPPRAKSKKVKKRRGSAGVW